MTATQIIQLYVFILAGFVGFLVITKVPPLLHTPLMSMTNAISAVTIIGALLLFSVESSHFEALLGAVALLTAAFNVIGGFAITGRMLLLFRKKGAGSE